MGGGQPPPAGVSRGICSLFAGAGDVLGALCAANASCRLAFRTRNRTSLHSVGAVRRTASCRCVRCRLWCVLGQSRKHAARKNQGGENRGPFQATHHSHPPNDLLIRARIFAENNLSARRGEFATAQVESQGPSRKPLDSCHSSSGTSEGDDALTAEINGLF